MVGDPGSEDLNTSGSFDVSEAVGNWIRNNKIGNYSMNNVTKQISQYQTVYWCPGNSTCFGTVEAPGIQRFLHKLVVYP